MYRFYGALLALGGVLVPFVASAQTAIVNGLPTQIVTCNGINCGLCDVAQLIQNIINFGIYIAVVGSALLFAYAGFLYLTSGGDSGKHSQARKVFTSVAIGLVIILGGWLVVDTIMKSVLPNGNINGWGPWNQICPGKSLGLILSEDTL